MSSKRVVRRELLDRVARRLLVRLLSPHEAFFAARGVDLSALAATDQNDRRLVRRVHDALHDDAALPAELRARLTLFDALANTSGQAALFEVCPPLAPMRLGCEDTAALALLDHPDAVTRAKRVADAGAGPLFTDFDAVSPRAPTVTPEAEAALVAAFRVWLRAHGRSELCTLHVADRGGELHLEIEHGRPPVTDDIVGESLDLTQVTHVRAERALVVFDRAASRLSVAASHAAIKELLRRLVGDHLFGDPEHFRRGGIYTLAPLAAGLDAALAFDDVPGVDGVALLAITLVAGDERVTREVRGKDDLRAVRRADELAAMLADDATVEWCKLRIGFEGRKRPIVMELSPSRRKLPRVPAEVEATVDEWMMARGYVVLSEHRRVVPSSAPLPVNESAETG